MMIGSKSKSSQIKFINLKEEYDQEGNGLKPSHSQIVQCMKLATILTLVGFVLITGVITLLFVLNDNLETKIREISNRLGNEIQWDENEIETLYERVGNSQEKIIELEKKNSQLKDALVEASVRAKKFETPAYELRLTPRKGNFYEVWEMCRQMGGDLMQKTLLTSTPGGNYHEQVRSFGITPEHKLLFIGITDLRDEGNWKFLNGEDFIEANSISSWNRDYSEPNGGRIENCGTAVLYGEPETPYPYFRLNDYRCNGYRTSQRRYGICEIKI